MRGRVSQLILVAEQQSKHSLSLLRRWAHAGDLEGPSKDTLSAIAFQVYKCPVLRQTSVLLDASTAYPAPTPGEPGRSIGSLQRVPPWPFLCDQAILRQAPELIAASFPTSAGSSKAPSQYSLHSGSHGPDSLDFTDRP